MNTRTTLPTRALPRALAGIALAAALAAPAAAQYTSFLDGSLGLGFDDVEITPDGRYAVSRDTAVLTETLVFDLTTGTLVFDNMSSLTSSCPNAGTASCSGPCNDAVAVTNTRAITLGLTVMVIDLTAQPPVLLAEFDGGVWPRDVEISDDGRFAIIRGGRDMNGGTYVVEMATGNVLLYSPSDPQSAIMQLGNDLCAAADFHGVSLAYQPNGELTNILVVEFDPSSGGGPQVVFDTATSMTGLAGEPMDVAISPNGMYATVRSADEVALVRLDGTNTSIVRRFSAFPAPTLPYFDSATDTVACTDTLWASITRGDGSTAAGYLDVEDIQTGQHWFAFLDGTPRDLVLTPDNESLLVHTGRKIYNFDLTNLPATTTALDNAQFRPFPATAAGILAGIDSVDATNEFAVVAAPNGSDTRLRIYDLTAATKPTFVFGTTMEGTPIDVALAPDNTYAVASTSTGSYLVVDLRTNEERIRVDRNLAGGFPWSDGVAIHPKHAAAFGIAIENDSGWIAGIDLVSREDLDCESLPNSTGENGELFALGSTRINENDLELHASHLPPNAAGLIFLASGTGSNPLGGGILCLGGSIIRLPIVFANAQGMASYTVDLTSMPIAGSGIVVGSTWYAQLAHRDLPSAQFFNYTNSSSLLFE